MKSRINGCRKYLKDEKTEEVEDIIFFYPESYIEGINNYEYKPLSQNDIICHFIIKEKLGEGAFGSVRLGINKQTGEKVAIKILEKSKLKKIEEKIRVQREIEILKKVKHPNIVQLYSVIETERQIFLIMEYIKGKELFQYILFKKKLSEEEACFYFQQIISGIEYLQKLKIAHRDIKPENMIIEQNTKNIKILDFGLSNTYGDKPNEMLNTACGSPCYTAPEMLSGKLYRGKGVDIWSVGVVLFSMICGYLPFHGDTNKETYKKIIEGKFYIPSHVSKNCRELITKILNNNPKKRINISRIKNHSWIKFYSNGLNNEGKSLFNVGLLTNKYVIPIDEDIIDEMEKLFKIPKIKTRTEILSNNSNEYTSLYYLLLNKKVSNGKKSVSDFKSELFLSYLKDNKNLLSNYDNNLDNIINARKDGILFEEKNDKSFFGSNLNINLKSQDNIYNIYSKNNIENKLVNCSNSSQNLKNNLNNKIIQTNNSFNNKRNVNLLNKLKIKIKINTNLTIENNKNAYSERKVLDSVTSKTTRNKNNNNLILKSVFTNNNKTIQNEFNSLIKRVTLSPTSNKKKSFQLSDKIKIKSTKSPKDIKKNLIVKKKYQNKKLKRSNNLKITKPIKYWSDEIEEENYSKSFEEKNQYNLKNSKNEETKENKDNTYNKKEKFKNKIIINDIPNNNNIKYKETISPFIETQKTINNTLENNKTNYNKTLESFSLQTINQLEIPLNYNKNKNIAECNYTNNFSEKKEKELPDTNNYIRKKGLHSYKSNPKIKTKHKNSKLLKNINKKIINDKIRINDYYNKIIDNNNTINNVIKKPIIDSSRNNNKLINNKNYFKTYKGNDYNKINTEVIDYSKIISKEIKNENITFNNNLINNNNLTNTYSLRQLKDFNYKTLINNNSSSFSNIIIKRKLDFKLSKNFKEKINKIINNIQIENGNFIRFNKINKKKYKSVEDNKKYCTNHKKEKIINSYRNNNINPNINLFNTANNNLKESISFQKFNKNNKLSLSSFKNKNSLNKEKKIYKSNIETPINNNTNNINNNEKLKNLKQLFKKKDNKMDYNMNDLEPFDLNCLFCLPRNIIKRLLIYNLEKLKYKVKQINLNKYIIYYGQYTNVYELNLSKNHSGIIKFKRIKGANNNYVNDIRKIIFKFTNC